MEFNEQGLPKIEGISYSAVSTKLRNVFEVSTEADENDGDLVYNTTTIQPSNFPKYLKVIAMIEEGYITYTGDRFSENGIEKLSGQDSDCLRDIIPHNEYGCHDLGISSIRYYDESGTVHSVSVYYNLEEMDDE